jgi:hypothetical protein
MSSQDGFAVAIPTHRGKKDGNRNALNARAGGD